MVKKHINELTRGEPGDEAKQIFGEQGEPEILGPDGFPAQPDDHEGEDDDFYERADAEAESDRFLSNNVLDLMYPKGLSEVGAESVKQQDAAFTMYTLALDMSETQDENRLFNSVRRLLIASEGLKEDDPNKRTVDFMMKLTSFAYEHKTGVVDLYKTIE